jgi:hypothetical protein
LRQNRWNGVYNRNSGGNKTWLESTVFTSIARTPKVVFLQKRGQADQARKQYVLALQKAYWQLQQWPGCIDDEIVEEMEGVLRDVGGDPASVPPDKPGLWDRLRRRGDK